MTALCSAGPRFPLRSLEVRIPERSLLRWRYNFAGLTMLLVVARTEGGKREEDGGGGMELYSATKDHRVRMVASC